MTSSLVGSEMCIRDSKESVVLLPTGSAALRSLTDLDGTISQARNIRPVSYTHLTLPTICSV
eukprot:6774957-Prorocentrum_lima.AAC.1